MNITANDARQTAERNDAYAVAERIRDVVPLEDFDRLMEDVINHNSALGKDLCRMHVACFPQEVAAKIGASRVSTKVMPRFISLPYRDSKLRNLDMNQWELRDAVMNYVQAELGDAGYTYTSYGYEELTNGRGGFPAFAIQIEWKKG